MNKLFGVVFFDGDCSLCLLAVRMILKWDSKERVKFSPLQSPYGKSVLLKHGQDGENFTSLLFLEEGVLYEKSEAILRIGRLLKWPVSFFLRFFFICPLFLRDAIYELVARNRYRLFGKESFRRISEEEERERFLIEE